MSRKGNQRTSYTEFIKVDEHMVLMTSDKNKGGGQRYWRLSRVH